MLGGMERDWIFRRSGDYCGGDGGKNSQFCVMAFQMRFSCGMREWPLMPAPFGNSWLLME
jgi:hypothetical protein